MDNQLTDPARVESLLSELDWCIENGHAGPRTHQAIKHARAVIAALASDTAGGAVQVGAIAAASLDVSDGSTIDFVIADLSDEGRELPIGTPLYAAPVAPAAPMCEPKIGDNFDPNIEDPRFTEMWHEIQKAGYSHGWLGVGLSAWRAALSTRTPIAADAAAPEQIGVQEAWEAAGGNPGIKADRQQLIDALKMLDGSNEDADLLGDLARDAAAHINAGNIDAARAVLAKARKVAYSGAAPKLAVWYGAMPESNGRTNWTAILHTGDNAEGFTIDRSEYPDRVRYEADRVRYLIGDLDVQPWITDYDADKHSGYVEPAAPTPTDASITACALMIQRICMTSPREEWLSKIEARIRFMLTQISDSQGVKK